jgi:hypothetical protein
MFMSSGFRDGQVKAAAWMRHMVRQVAIEDFPACWQDVTPRERSHDSRAYTKRFMGRLDHPSQAKLEQLIAQCSASKADIIRHLIAQAEREDFPKSWHRKAAEHHGARVRYATPLLTDVIAMICYPYEK